MREKPHANYPKPTLDPIIKVQDGHWLRGVTAVASLANAQHKYTHESDDTYSNIFTEAMTLLEIVFLLHLKSHDSFIPRCNLHYLINDSSVSKSLGPLQNTFTLCKQASAGAHANAVDVTWTKHTCSDCTRQLSDKDRTDNRGKQKKEEENLSE